MPSLNGVRVPVVDSGTTTDPQLYVSVGLTQLSGVSLTSGAAIGVYLQAQINATSLTNTARRPVFFSVVLEADSGNDYWYDYANSSWTDFGSALNAGYQDPNDADWAVGVLSKVELRPRQVADIIMEMPSLPTAGKIRISLYNVVETQVLSPEEITHVTWYRARLAVLGGNDEEALSTRTIATDTSSVHNRYRPEATFWTGEGPTSFHDSRITYSGGTLAADWQVGAYPASPASGHTASGDGLDKLHGAVILASRYTPLKRVRATIKIDSGSLWPHQPLKYGSDYYSIINMEQDVARCQYTVEATEVISPTVTDSIVTEGLTSAPAVPGLGGGGPTFYVPAVGRSHIYIKGIEGDLDDLDDGSTYGRVLATSISAGQIILAQVSGDLDDVADGTTSVKWNASGVPPSATSVGSAGLYLGTDKMGYYDGSEWRTYMDSSGNLRLVDSDGASTFEVYVAGAPNQLSFSIEAATALGGYVILNSEDAKQMQVLAEDAKITLFGSNSSTAPGEPWIGFDGDLMADSSGHTIGGGPGGDSWAGLYISGLGEFSVLAGGEATAEGVTLRNTTAATVSVDQFSPALRWEGRGWETATGTSDTVVFQSYVETIKGTAAAGTWHLQASLNGGAYSDVLTVTSGGVIGGATWQGTVIASAYLDTDTAHLSETQTFSGAKTFGLGTTFTGAIVVNGGIQSDLIPTTDSTRDLGSATYRWAQVHTDDLYVAGDTKTDLIPDVTNTLDLGSASKQWQDVYAVNGVFASNLTLGGTDVSLSGHTHTASEITDLATAATGITKVGTIATGTWQGTAIASAYLDADTAHLSGTQTFTGAKSFSADVTVSADFDPGGSALYDHGTAALRWRTGYFVNIDASTDVATGTVTVATDVVHAGDTNTKISFTSDNIQLEAGGVIMLDLDEGATDKATFGADVYIPEYLYHDGDTDTYLQFGTNTLTLSAGANAAFSLTSSNIGITTSMSARTITPQTDDTYDLGSATYYWNNCFLTNADVDTLSAKDGSTIVVNANLSDDIGGLYSLGASGTRWLKTWTGALDANGTVTFGGLPTSSGGATGTLWNDSGTIKIN